MNASAPIKKKDASRSKLALLILLCLLLKLALGGYYVVKSQRLAPFTLLTQAIAQDEMREGAPESADGRGKETGEETGEETGDPGNEEKDFATLGLLQEKEMEIAKKEEALKEEEARLSQLKVEIEARLAALAETQKKIEQLIPVTESEEEKELIKLAKVFEATPPEQAGPMFNRLDVDIAAKILLRMKGRNAGKIWGYVDPEQAVKISQELAKLK